MKKFISGVIVGALIMVSPQVYGAASSIIGKKVDGELVVKIDGKQAGKAAVVDGKSYLPVRDVANELGLKINVENKEVVITSTSEDKIAEEVKKQVEAIKTENEISELKKEKQKISERLESNKSGLEEAANWHKKSKERYEQARSQSSDLKDSESQKKIYESAKAGHENLQNKITEDEKELERINTRLKELGAE
ncbi:hypothetical protein M3661_28945 [Paenibacillus sp. MER 180]|uniref:stalk domain-containing protein n=1 Tax=Paenibacillus sp. MER 180 TaxID=2939570 RepID=UPI0020406C67|nr:hypothetical protein [Paenibacillus sp. MER 180]MCM3294128.1 hypothetical protein [Paenibacillus sp. MER 180]